MRRPVGPTGPPVLAAVVQAAVDATAASGGWVLAAGSPGPVVVASSSALAALVGRALPAGVGAAAFVLSAAQPLAIQPEPGVATGVEDVAALLGRPPASVLAVPCLDDEDVVGVLVLVDRAGGAAFTFDDVEVGSVLGRVAAAALADERPSAPPPPPPAELSRRLERLAADDPDRYARVAPLLDVVLGPPPGER